MKCSLLIAVNGGIMKYSAKQKPVLISKWSFGCLCIVHWLCSQDLKQTQGKFTSRITKIIHDFLMGLQCLVETEASFLDSKKHWLGLREHFPILMQSEGSREGAVQIPSEGSCSVVVWNYTESELKKLLVKLMLCLSLLVDRTPCRIPLCRFLSSWWWIWMQLSSWVR